MHITLFGWLSCFPSIVYPQINKITAAAKTSRETMIIPIHANTVLLLFNPNIPKVIDNMSVTIATGMSIIIVAISSHHITLPESGITTETKRQKRNTMSKIAIGAAAKIKLNNGKTLFLLISCIPFVIP